MSTAVSWFTLSRFDDPPKPPEPPQPKPGDPPKPPGGSDDKPEPKPWTPPASQDELDRIISDRLKRQQAQFAGYDDLKKKAEEFDKLQEAQKTELERERDARTKAEETAQKATERANRALIRAAVVDAATKAKAIAPDDVLAVLPDGAITIGDDGTLSGVSEAVAAALAARPHWVVNGRPQGSADGGAQLPTDPKDFRTADQGTFTNELAKYGLRPRS